MKLRNKKTGEVVEAESCKNTGGLISIYYEEKGGQIGTKDCYSSLAELNEEWEDVPEEPKKYYFIDPSGEVGPFWEDEESPEDTEASRQIGNYFLSREEAELAVRKLKAWKRLKNKGFRFDGWDNTDRATIHDFSLFVTIEDLETINKDLDLLFGGEE